MGHSCGHSNLLKQGQIMLHLIMQPSENFGFLSSHVITEMGEFETKQEVSVQ